MIAFGLCSFRPHAAAAAAATLESILEATYRALGEPSEEEREMLECAIDTRPTSRLSCQVELGGTRSDWIIRLPASQL